MIIAWSWFLVKIKNGIFNLRVCSSGSAFSCSALPRFQMRGALSPIQELVVANERERFELIMLGVNGWLKI